MLRRGVVPLAAVARSSCAWAAGSRRAATVARSKAGGRWNHSTNVCRTPARTIVKSTYPDIEIPHQSLPHFMLDRAHTYGDKPAFVCGLTGRTLSFNQSLSLSLQVAAGLKEIGFGLDSVLGLHLPNVLEYAALVDAAAILGGAVSGGNPGYTPDEIVHQITKANIKFFITIPQLKPVIAKVEELLKSKNFEVPRILYLGEDSFKSILRPADEKLLENSPVDPGDVVLVPFSSGTSGVPKGVQLTHRNLIANVLQTIAVEGYNSQNSFVAVLPFFHIYGFTMMAGAFAAGATQVVLPKFDLEAYLKVINQYKATHLHIVPPMAVALLKHPLAEKADLSSIQTVLSGAAPLGAETEAALSKRIGVPIRQGYGLTELSPVAHIVPITQARSGSIGKLVPNTWAKVVDVDGNEVKLGEQGEMLLKGPQVMKGYLDPKNDEGCFDGEWFRTGDVVRYTEDGFFFITDRVKELIKYKGFQVAPAELEALLLSHPGVADVVVFGLPATDCGELPRALVVKKDKNLTEQELLDFTAQHLASHKRLRGGIIFVDAVPKSATGKLLRRVAKAQYGSIPPPPDAPKAPKC